MTERYGGADRLQGEAARSVMLQGSGSIPVSGDRHDDRHRVIVNMFPDLGRARAATGVGPE